MLGFSFFFKVESTLPEALANAQKVVTSRMKPLRVVSCSIFINYLCLFSHLQPWHNRSYRCGHRHPLRAPEDDNAAQLAPCRYLGRQGGDRVWRSWASQGFLWTQHLWGIFGREWRVSSTISKPFYLFSTSLKCMLLRISIWINLVLDSLSNLSLEVSGKKIDNTHVLPRTESCSTNRYFPLD